MKTDRHIFRNVILALSLSLGLMSVDVHAVDDEGDVRRRPRNLLSNPDFSVVLPKDWTRDAFIFSEDLFLFRQQGRNIGQVGISIPADVPNDVRWIQTVDIEPNRTYRLSGWIRTQDVGHTSEFIDVGANLSLLNWGSGQGIIDIVTKPLLA
jgi:hypothetical protein